MVCDRCVSVVKSELKQLGYTDVVVDMGEITFNKALTSAEREQIGQAVKTHGFELIDDKKSTLIEKIKNIVISQIHHSKDIPKVNYSTLISEKLGKEYSYLSNMFSEVEGITLEQFIILHKIEKVKELLVYDELTLSQIADELGYSSVAHLSGQFKKVSGFTPSYFKSIKKSKRISIDKVKSLNDIKQSHKDVKKKS